MSNAEQFHGPEEDPLADDIDAFVHPDETRTDEQIAYDQDVANRLHMSGAEDSDEYWDEYNELYADDGREKIRFTFGTGYAEIAKEDLERDYPGMSHEEVQERVDAEYQEMLERNRQIHTQSLLE